MSVKSKTASVRSVSLASKDRLSFLNRVPDEDAQLIRSYNPGQKNLAELNEEIRALELERANRAREHELRGFKDELKAREEFALADQYRHRHHHHHHHDRAGDLALYDGTRGRPRIVEDEVMLFDRERSRRRSHDDELVVYDRYGRKRYYKRTKSPPKNVVRVEKDRRGRLSLVKSTH
ncbi:Hypothetical predicted protein [Lecanosticta acicola]|uniref:Uncharacterized protein n=1 Tax=Lecanosticta acicola TaxID=111012 RepID=A0AAI8Z683_9PEZI|nr:Hypothetical predicted protein [Lecanosticta acicola]